MTEIDKILEHLELDEALTTIAAAADRLLAHVSDEERRAFVVSLIGDGGADKISSMVSL